jgi:hypothetical protein
MPMAVTGYYYNGCSSAPRLVALGFACWYVMHACRTPSRFRVGNCGGCVVYYMAATHAVMMCLCIVPIIGCLLAYQLA